MNISGRSEVAVGPWIQRPFNILIKMGNALPHTKVKLVIGLISNDASVLKKTEALVTKKFGPADYKSHVMDFRHTDYYNDELGEDLNRVFISMQRLISPEKIYRVKLITNGIERGFSIAGKRKINIDPGYLTLGKLVLLTTKDYSHRVYLGSGIYAEPTLRFQNGTYTYGDYTYPDYKSGDYIETFNDIRKLYKKQLTGVTGGKSK